jgi:hypothetical protein
MRRRKRNMRSWKKETNKNMLILLGWNNMRRDTRRSSRRKKNSWKKKDWVWVGLAKILMYLCFHLNSIQYLWRNSGIRNSRKKKRNNDKKCWDKRKFNIHSRWRKNLHQKLKILRQTK